MTKKRKAARQTHGPSALSPMLGGQGESSLGDRVASATTKRPEGALDPMSALTKGVPMVRQKITHCAQSLLIAIIGRTDNGTRECRRTATTLARAADMDVRVAWRTIKELRVVGLITSQKARQNKNVYHLEFRNGPELVKLVDKYIHFAGGDASVSDAGVSDPDVRGVVTPASPSHLMESLCGSLLNPPPTPPFGASGSGKGPVGPAARLRSRGAREKAEAKGVARRATGLVRRAREAQRGGEPGGPAAGEDLENQREKAVNEGGARGGEGALGDDVAAVVEHWQGLFARHFPDWALTPGESRHVVRRLRGFSVAQLIRALEGAARSPHNLRSPTERLSISSVLGTSDRVQGCMRYAPKTAPSGLGKGVPGPERGGSGTRGGSYPHGAGSGGKTAPPGSTEHNTERKGGRGLSPPAKLIGIGVGSAQVLAALEGAPAPKSTRRPK